MSALTHDQVKAVVGPIGEEKLAAVIATGAKLEDVVEAEALVAGESDIVGQGESPIRGPVMEVYVILTSGGVP